MLFNCPVPVRLVNVRSFVSKKGNNVTFLTVADTNTFENVDFLPAEDVNLSSLEIGRNYTLNLNTNGRFTSASLVPLPVGK